MKEQCVDKNVGPAARCRSAEIRGVCVKVLKQRMAFCNFPLAAAERCERVNVDVYAPRNMLNVIDSMAEINTYWRIEHATLTPSVFTCTGGAGPAATQCLKRLGSQIADKHQMAYSQAMGWLRCRLSFALLRSSILCLRGARARVKQNFLLQPAVALAEGGMC